MNREEFRPLLATFSARDSQVCAYWRERIRREIKNSDYLITKYYITCEALKIIRDFFLENEEYTHLIMITEDAVVYPDVVKLLIKDSLMYDFPIVSAYMNFDCKHPYMNITTKNLMGLIPFSAYQYDLMSKDEIFNWSKDFPFLRVFYQGWTCQVIQRWVVEKIPFRGVRECKPREDIEIFGYPKPRPCFHDLAWCQDLYKNGIPNIVDLRALCYHFGNTVMSIKARGKVRYVKLSKNGREWRIIREDEPYTKIYNLPSTQVDRIIGKPMDREEFIKKFWGVKT